MVTTFFLFIYQLLLVPVGLAYLILRLLKGRGVPGLRQRLGFYPRDLRQALSKFERPVWIHMVSVGEVIGGERLIQELRTLLPGVPWVITTTTPTGQSVAAKLVRGSSDKLLYLPWDLGFSVGSAVRAIRPRLFICFETELWPVLFRRLEREGVPIAIVNGRISPKAYRRYIWIRPLMEIFLRPVRFFLVQSPQDAKRYASIGAAKDRISVTGNVKWDIGADGDASSDGGPGLRSLLGLVPAQLLWTAGSTHAGEEKIVLETYKKLRGTRPDLRLLLAPRHPERIPEVEREAAALDLPTVRRSGLEAGTKKDAVILLDTVGELKKFYRVSDIVFVGGSLIPKGGHNLMEPAAFSRPIVTGPHLHNFAHVAELLSQAGGLAVVKSPEELELRVRSLIENPGQRQDLGKRAFAVIAENRGATTKTAQALLRLAGR